MSTLFTHFFTKFNQIVPLESNFTEVLESIALKPKILYFHGKLPENVSKNGVTKRPKVVAIVGSRRNTRYGEEIAYEMAYELAKRGVIVVSGLAYGIDSIAHKGALDADGCTVAVLGTPIDQIYPRAHEKLAKDIIAQGGAIISELEPGAKFYPKTSFLKRNRIIAGLSDAVVIVEAAVRSGSLNTAAHALEQGKDVFAVPGNITSPYSMGCNKLIRQGASPYTCLDDLLSVLFPEEFVRRHNEAALKVLAADTKEEAAILQALSRGLRTGEEIIEFTQLSAQIFSQFITLLEIKGQVRALGGNHWSLM
jgi:DNA processing protein